jgi:diguanylate cyclase (GGDEF)-like protein
MRGDGGIWWVGGQDGLRLLRPGTPEGTWRFESDPRFDGLRGSWVTDLETCSDRTRWAATQKSLYRFRDDGEPPVAVARPGSPWFVRRLTCDALRRVWALDQGGRLWRADSRSVAATSIRLPGGAGAVPEEMMIGPDGDLWIALGDGGSIAVDPRTDRIVERIEPSSELAHLSPISIQPWAGDTYLASSRDAISLVSLHPPAVRRRLFSQADLGGVDLEHLLASRDPTGGYEFISLGVLLRFLPGGWRPAPPFPLSLERVTDGRTNREIVPDSRGVYGLPPRPNDVDLLVAAPDHVAPLLVKYRSRVRGSGPGWTAWRSDPHVRLMHLPPGEQEVEIESLDRFGRKNPSSLSVRLSVLPRLWERIPFQATALALAVLLALGLDRLRLRRLLRRQQELEGAVADRTRELAAANERLAESSLTDPLTSLRNRRFVTETLREEFASTLRAAPSVEGPLLAFLMIDLDHFKDVNDRLGHAMGDRVLADFAGLLGRVLRKGDTAVRWGGEEFLVISRNPRTGGGAQLAERIRIAAERLPGPTPDARIRCSIGVAELPFSALLGPLFDWSSAISLADAALYRAKQLGRNRWVVFAAREEGIREAARDATPDAVLRRLLAPTEVSGRDDLVEEIGGP